MLGDLMGMMGKLKETKEKVKEAKEQLHNVILDEQSSNGLLSVTITANRTIKSIHIDEKLMEDKEQLENLLIITINKA
ncbi:MAG: YbaB/EbfC family nucleoid-associated protein, partial [Flavobacteriaceae bacterium]